mgnify:FL=1
MVNFSNLERIDMVMLYGAADGNVRLARELWIARFPSVIGPKEYCKLENKFCNALKKSPTSAVADLQLKLEFHDL